MVHGGGEGLAVHCEGGGNHGRVRESVGAPVIDWAHGWLG